jgi:lipopolysaccharide transport system ATP-binding protein
MRMAVELQGVTIDFPRSARVGGGRFEAISDLTFTLNHAEKLGVIGRNGSGKSTLLRLLAGVLVPDKGTIHRDHGSCQLLSLGLAFADYLTGRENAVLSGLFLGLSRREIGSRLEAIAEFAELGDFFDQPIGTYSSGMKARLSFSVALEQQPDILLIDEVLSVGDAAFREKSRLAIRDRLTSETTVVLVAHDEELIRQVCDRVLWIEHGKLIAVGPADEVLERYRTTDLSVVMGRAS